MRHYDFRRYPGRRLRASHLLALLALAALLASGGMAWQAQEQGERLQQAGLAAPAPQVAPMVDHSAETSARALLALPWASLFADLDAALDERSALLELEPDAEAGRLRIVAEASDPAAMLAFVERLQHVDSLHDARLASHRLQDSGAAVRFVVRALWRPGPASSVVSNTPLHNPAGR